VNGVRFTHIGGPTVLIEVGGWRLLTDPTFDPPGRRYSFGWGSSSRKVTGPAVAPAELPPIDAVLLSHDHHGDNLDAAIRALLPAAGGVLTTTAGGGRLGSKRAATACQGAVVPSALPPDGMAHSAPPSEQRSWPARCCPHVWSVSCTTQPPLPGPSNLPDRRSCRSSGQR